MMSHASDCALHNAPAMPTGSCDCGGPARLEVAEAHARAMQDIGGVDQETSLLARCYLEVLARISSLEAQLAAITTERDARIAFKDQVNAGLQARIEGEEQARGYLVRVLEVAAPGVKPMRKLMEVCAQVDNVIAGLTTERRTPEDAAVSIGREIIEIMETYDEQEAKGIYGGTPGGLEHMGDVWGLLSRWRDELKRAQHPTPSQGTTAFGVAPGTAGNG